MQDISNEEHFAWSEEANMFVLVPGPSIETKIRSDVNHLGGRCPQFGGHLNSRTHRNLNHGIDSMSFVLENQAEQITAYAFSKHWVGRVF